jgi:hypothetical protein
MSGPGYDTVEMPDGSILQAGVWSGPDWDSTEGWITRAVVLKTYFADDHLWKNRAWAQEGQNRVVVCDVRTLGRRSRDLKAIPVAQRTSGLFDEDIYIPRGASKNIEGGPLVSEGKAEGSQATAAEVTDGDYVLVAFLESDPHQPFILPFCFPHPNAKNFPKQEDGRVKRFRHNGTLIKWDENGNLTIDATGAAKDELDANGEEQSASGDGGQITIKTSDGTNVTSIHLDNTGQVRFGSDPTSAADEPMIMGNLWIDVMGRLIDAITQLTVIASGSPSSTPVNTAAFLALKTEIESKAQVSDFIFGKKAH